MTNQKLKQKLQQKLTPQQLLLMRLLQAPVIQLEQKIKEEVEQNPMLELEQADEEPLHDMQEEEDNGDDDFNGIDLNDYLDDDDYSYRERQERDLNTPEHRFELSDSASFTDNLMEQLRMQPLNERQERLATEIIGSLDGSGYLSRDLSLIANDMAFRANMDVSDEEMEQTLRLIQHLDPAGVGARNLQECLSLQLHRIDQPDEATLLATTIIDHYFQQLTNKHYDIMMRQLKIDKDELEEAIHVIQHLNPKPGWGREESSKGAPTITPDFIVTRDGDHLHLVLSDHNNPKLRLNNEYSELLQKLSIQPTLNKSEKETLRFIKDKSEDAHQLIDTLGQRQTTLYNTMSSILHYQRKFFLSGMIDDLRPMRLKDIAEMTHYDESTISRVVNQKYVLTDYGTFLLKDLFTKAVVNEKGEEMGTETIKKVLRQIIEQEDKQQPLTDEALAARLAQKGIQLSRRTVTKYRKNMDIPEARLRKKL